MDTTTDLEKLQGTWTVTSLEVDGEEVPATSFNGSQIVIAGKRFTSIAMGVTYKGTVEFPNTKKLKAFDLLFTVGPEKGNRNLGIYELDGDRWTICLATRGTKRPTAFATRPGTGIALETLQRAGRARSTLETPRKSKRPARQTTRETPPAPAGNPTDWEGEWTMLSGVFSGATLDKTMVGWCKRITRGNVTSVVAGPQVMLKATFTLDRAAHPNTVDYMNLAGTHAGRPQAGIFELTGDTLKVCVSAPGRPRPTDFTSTSGDGRSLTAWQRAAR